MRAVKLLRRRVASTDVQQPFDFENEYDSWRAKNPRIRCDASIDERGNIFWLWSTVVSMACFYNMIMCTMFVFDDVRKQYSSTWRYVNLFADFIFLLDIFVQSRIGFFEEGVVITDLNETRKNYFKSTSFVVDVFAILPFDFTVIAGGETRIGRLNRFLKVYRIAQLIDYSYARVKQVSISLSRIVVVCFLLFHWNACAFFNISEASDTSKWNYFNATFDDDVLWPWPYLPEKITDIRLIACDESLPGCKSENFYFDEAREDHFFELWQHWNSNNRSRRIAFSQLIKEYAVSMYWSAMTMTTLGEQPSPNTSGQNVFEVLNTVVGLLLFAGIMGSVGDLVANANKVQASWQALMDGLKQYMAYRSLPGQLQERVLKYCAYEMSQETILKEDAVRQLLPVKLYAQINRNLIARSLLKSPLFRASERSFLREISEHLLPQYFSPGEVVVEEDHLNTEMFVVVSGTVSEVGDDIDIVYSEGEIVGDANLIWFANHKRQNRRCNPLVSNAYSQVHVLHRDDFLRILMSYGELKSRLFDIAYRMQIQKGELLERERTQIDEESLEDCLQRLQLVVNNVDESLKGLEVKFVVDSEVVDGNEAQIIRRRMDFLSNNPNEVQTKTNLNTVRNSFYNICKS